MVIIEIDGGCSYSAALQSRDDVATVAADEVRRGVHRDLCVDCDYATKDKR